MISKKKTTGKKVVKKVAKTTTKKKVSCKPTTKELKTLHRKLQMVRIELPDGRVETFIGRAILLNRELILTDPVLPIHPEVKVSFSEPFPVGEYCENCHGNNIPYPDPYLVMEVS